LINSTRHILKDDELEIVMAKMQADRFSGGFRLKMEQIWDLPTARCRFGKYLRVAVNGRTPEIARLVKEFPAQRVMTDQGELIRGLPVRLSLSRHGQGEGVGKDMGAGVGVSAEIQLGDQAQFFPTDAALASWMAQAEGGKAVIAYE
jgi:DNA polymerase-3 subunit alpha